MSAWSASSSGRQLSSEGLTSGLIVAESILPGESRPEVHRGCEGSGGWMGVGRALGGKRSELELALPSLPPDDIVPLRRSVFILASTSASHDSA